MKIKQFLSGIPAAAMLAPLIPQTAAAKTVPTVFSAQRPTAPAEHSTYNRTSLNILSRGKGFYNGF